MIRPPEGVLEPAYMAFALPPGSALKKPLDEALVGITASQEWRQIEQSYFGHSAIVSLPTCRSAAAAAKGAAATAASDSAQEQERPEERRRAAACGRGRRDAEDQHGNRQRQHQNRHEEAAAPERDGQRRADRADHRQRRVPRRASPRPSASGTGAIASMSPNSGLKTTSGNALVVQWAAHLMSTAIRRQRSVDQQIERSVFVIGLEQPIEP